MSRISLAPLAVTLLGQWRLSAPEMLLVTFEQMVLSYALEERARLGASHRATTLRELIEEHPLTVIAAVVSLGHFPEPGHPDLLFLPPHVNHSGVGYRVETATENALRRPLNASARLAPAALRRIVRTQPFGSIEELEKRAVLDGATTWRLARAGTLDGLPGKPHHGQRPARVSTPATPLFTEGEGVMSESYRGPQLVERVLARLSHATDEAPDPLSEHRSMLDELEVLPLSELASLREGHSVRIAGRRIGRATSSRSSETPLVSVLLDDGSGQCEVVLIGELAQAYGAQLAGARSLLFDGVLSTRDDTASLLASGAWSLADMGSRWRATRSTSR